MVDKDLLQTKGHDPELLAAFEQMCREREWKQSDVISFFLETAVRMDHTLALPLYRWIQTRKQKKWKRPESLDY